MELKGGWGLARSSIMVLRRVGCWRWLVLESLANENESPRKRLLFRPDRFGISSPGECVCLLRRSYSRLLTVGRDTRHGKGVPFLRPDDNATV